MSLPGPSVVLRAVDLAKSFTTGAVRLDVLTGIDFAITQGEIVAILGASGVGKSTLLHLLGGLDRPTRGRVLIDSTDIFALPDDQIAAVRNRTLGFVFQFHHLLPEFTAVENVMMPLLIGGQAHPTAYDHARALLAEVGLEQRLHHKPGELSGGEQQRVAVARALVGRPLVVLADEPSGNLDRGNSEALLTMIWTLSRSHRQAFVIVTHDEEIGQRTDRMFRLRDGRLHELDRERVG
ncbi:MAG: ATP-binding cassette domain-containing protein [Candidatus Latescibacteria bacterium]|nr:ATP-binding cassette domain-containing protein [Candidatus Latescibacterota bacterium]